MQETTTICPLCSAAAGEPMECMGTLGHPRIGTRFELRRHVDRSPDFIARAGMKGTLVEDVDGQFSILMDDHVEGCEEWHNEVVWNFDAWEKPEDAMLDLRVLHDDPAPCQGSEDEHGRPNCPGTPTMLVRCDPSFERKETFFANYCEDCAHDATDENIVTVMASGRVL